MVGVSLAWVPGSGRTRLWRGAFREEAWQGLLGTGVGPRTQVWERWGAGRLCDQTQEQGPCPPGLSQATSVNPGFCLLSLTHCHLAFLWFLATKRHKAISKGGSAGWGRPLLSELAQLLSLQGVVRQV